VAGFSRINNEGKKQSKKKNQKVKETENGEDPEKTGKGLDK